MEILFSWLGSLQATFESGLSLNCWFEFVNFFKGCFVSFTSYKKMSCQDEDT